MSKEKKQGEKGAFSNSDTEMPKKKQKFNIFVIAFCFQLPIYSIILGAASV